MYKIQSPKIVLFVRYSDLYKKRLKLDAAYSRLKKYILSDAINVLSRIDLKLGYHQAKVFEKQIELCDNMGCRGIINHYNSYIKANPERALLGRHIFFHEHQIYNAVKLCLHHCTSKQTKLHIQPWHQLTEALLIINDYLTPKRLERMTRKTISKMDIMQYVIRNALFHKYDSPKHLIARWYELVFESYNLLHENTPDLINIEQKFFTRYKIRPHDYLSVCLAFFTYWFGLKEKQIDKGMVTLNSTTFKAKFKMDKKIYEKVIVEISAPAKWYKQNLKGKRFNPYNFLPLQKKPVLKNNGNFQCLSKKFLVEKFTTGFYHMMIDCFSGSEVEDFLTFFGKVYENYLTNILNNEFNKSRLAKRFFESKKYNKGKNCVDSCDGIIDYGNVLLVMEFKAKLFSYDFLSKGKDKNFQDKFNEIVFRSARELNTTIRDLKNGTLVISEIDIKRVRYFFPVIVSLQPIPMTRILYDYINDELKKKGYLQQPYVAKMEVVDTFELEAMLAISNLSKGKSLVDLIKEKGFKGIEYFSMGDYIFQKYKNADISPRHIKEKFNHIVQQYMTFWALKKTQNKS